MVEMVFFGEKKNNCVFFAKEKKIWFSQVFSIFLVVWFFLNFFSLKLLQICKMIFYFKRTNKQNKNKHSTLLICCLGFCMAAILRDTATSGGKKGNVKLTQLHLSNLNDLIHPHVGCLSGNKSAWKVDKGDWNLMWWLGSSQSIMETILLMCCCCCSAAVQHVLQLAFASVQAHRNVSRGISPVVGSQDIMWEKEFVGKRVQQSRFAAILRR